MVTELTKDYKAVLEKETKPYVIELYTPWCGICQQVKPIYEGAAMEYDNTYGFYRANVDEMMEIAKEHNVSSVPSFLFIKDGKVVTTHHGYITKEDIIDKLTEAFK